jgi:hypothetical protein
VKSGGRLGKIITGEVNGPKIMKENARTIIRLIPFFDAFLKISPLDIGPRIVYSNRNLLV